MRDVCAAHGDRAAVSVDGCTQVSSLCKVGGRGAEEEDKVSISLMHVDDFVRKTEVCPGKEGTGAGEQHKYTEATVTREYLCIRMTARLPCSQPANTSEPMSRERGSGSYRWTELLLAFALGGAEGEGALLEVEGGGGSKVFAFLPVYSAGLKFVVHADFELVASRQQLRHDSEWNQLLRSKVARAAQRMQKNRRQ